MDGYYCAHLDDIEPLSVCCGASAISDTDFCAQCREHTGFERYCDECDIAYPEA